MTRVVPSQVVATIAQLFPGSRDSTSRASYSIGQAGALQGIVDLVKQIPQELLILRADQYAGLVVARGAIENCLLAFASRDSRGILLQPVMGRDPLVIIREALLQCPDEYPPPSTADLQFISDQDLRDNIRRDVGAADQALHNGEWKAATVLAGAAIEALLHWRLGELSPAELDKGVTAAISQGKLKQNQKLADLNSWESLKRQVVSRTRRSPCHSADRFFGLASAAPRHSSS